MVLSKRASVLWYGLVCAWSFLPNFVLASSSGIHGYTGRVNSCVTCHSQDSQAADRGPIITIATTESTSQIVAGTTLGIEVKARRAVNSANRWAGFNAEVFYEPTGALTVAQVGPEVQSFSNLGIEEVSHTSKKDFLQGAVQEGNETFYEVAWTFFVKVPLHYRFQTTPL